MIFTFLLLVSFILAFLTIILFIIAVSSGEEEPLMGAVVSAFAAFVIGSLVLLTWKGHADNIATVHHQQPVIDALTERVEGITERLSNFDYPRAALVNRDTPVAAIVASLDNAESQLASAKLAQGEAIRALEATRIGPMSHVFWWVGDYK